MKLRHKTQTKLAYWSGALTAKLHNTYYNRTDTPSFLVCMRDFTILRTLFGKYYSLMKNNRFCNPYILKYEELNRLDLDSNLVGNHIDFCLGYADTIKREKL